MCICWYVQFPRHEKNVYGSISFGTFSNSMHSFFSSWNCLLWPHVFGGGGGEKTHYDCAIKPNQQYQIDILFASTEKKQLWNIIKYSVFFYSRRLILLHQLLCSLERGRSVKYKFKAIHTFVRIFAEWKSLPWKNVETSFRMIRSQLFIFRSSV